MKEQVIKNQEASSEVKISKISEYRKQLASVSEQLDVMADMSGRKDYSYNQLLRECYQLVGKELHSFDGWKKRGASVRKGQHAYLFWGKPRKGAEKKYCPVIFLFSQEQVEFKREEAL